MDADSRSCRCHDPSDNSAASPERVEGGDLSKNPPAWWYRCRCGRRWIRINFEGYHTGSSTYYAALVDQAAIDTFKTDRIDDIFLASDRVIVGGYDHNDRSTVYTGGFPVDPWYGFRREERLKKARDFAVKAHGDQKYGDKPYVHHLEMVQDVMKRHHIASSDLLVLIAGWLHDVIEDTPVTREELARSFGEDVADIVHRVSDAPGANRKERKMKTYPKIRGHIKATVVKLADRIANVTASAENPKKLAMYASEYPDFRKALHVADHTFLDKMWGELDGLLR